MRKYRFMTLVCGLSLLAALWGSPIYAQDDPHPPAPDSAAETTAPPAAPEATDNPVAPEGENGAAVEVPGVANAEPDVAVVVVEKAPAGEPPTALAKLTTEVMNILIPAFLTLIGLLVAWVLNWVRKKFHLNVSDAQIDAWSKLAEKAANRGAEWARAKAKAATDGKKIPGPEVLEVAVDWAIEMGRVFKLPEMGREKLIGLIEGHLFTEREESV